ncbi:MAG: sensor histidine kinase [Oscillospiraceae bacterium]|nr:sensor histidine kinase [Oscillospiraceae bacterium]
MKVSTEVSLYLLSNSLRIYSSIRLLMAFMMTDKKRVVRPVLVLVAVLYYIINSILFLSVNIPVLTLASNLIPLFLISVMIRRKFWVNLLATFFTVLAEVLSEALIMVFVDDSLIASSGLASALLLYMASFFAAYCLSGKKLHRITPVLAFSFLVIPCCCIVFSTMIMRNRGWETTLSAVCMVVVNITVFYIYIQINSSMEQNYRNKMVEQQRRAYKSEMELVKQNTDQIEMFRHDVKNHMSQLRMLLQYQKYDDLERYLLQAENRLQSSEQFVDTGNYIIDNIVNCKLTRAAEMGARIQTDIQMPGENIGIDDFDLNVIFGNLLDNANESLQKCSSENRSLQLSVHYTQGILFICLDNSCEDTPRVRNNVFVTSKRDVPGRHGIGLLSVRSALEKYQGSIDFSYSAETFSTTLLLYANPEQMQRMAS